MRHKKTIALSLILLGIFVACGRKNKTSNSSSSAEAAPSAGNEPRGQLTNEKVQTAIDKALSVTTKGGRAIVLGIEELPEDNAAKVDLKFEQFTYVTSDQGMPVTADAQTKSLPKDNTLDSSRAPTRLTVQSYSGPGVGVLKHYADGRWAVTEVRFNFVGVHAIVQIE